MKNTLLTTLLLLASGVLFSQEMISTAGDYSVCPNASISYTIGEPIIETLQSGSFQLTQGFHQTMLTISNISAHYNLDYTIKVYPNPTHDYVVVDLITSQDKIEFVLTDMNGKTLTANSLIESTTIIDMQQFNPGVYLISFTNYKKQIATYKIVKQ